jgi:hypothetical protein
MATENDDQKKPAAAATHEGAAPAEKKDAGDPKVSAMLKSLGYYADPAVAEKLPEENEDEDQGEQAAGESIEEAPEDKPKDDAGGEESAEEKTEDSGNAEAEGDSDTQDDSEKEPEQAATEKRARKVAPAKKQEPLLADDIKDAVREAVREASAEKKTDAAERKDDSRAGFHPVEVKNLEFAEYAAKAMPEKYRDMPKRELEWIGKQRQFVANAVKENGKFDPDDEQYRAFVRENKPTYQSGDREELFMMQAEDRAAARARREIEPEIEKRDREIAELRFSPAIQRTVTNVEADILSGVGKEIEEVYRSDPRKVSEEFPIEAPVIGDELLKATQLTQGYLRLAKGVDQYDKDNPVHNSVIKFIGAQGQFVDRRVKEGKAIERNGKVIISREAYGQMVEAKKDVSRYTTFTDADVVNMIAASHKQAAIDGIKAARERHQKISEKLSAKKAAPGAAGAEKKVEPTAKKTEAPPPKAGVTKSPGPQSKPSAGGKEPNFMKSLGLSGAKGEKAN